MRIMLLRGVVHSRPKGHNMMAAHRPGGVGLCWHVYGSILQPLMSDIDAIMRINTCAGLWFEPICCSSCHAEPCCPAALSYPAEVPHGLPSSSPPSDPHHHRDNAHAGHIQLRQRSRAAAGGSHPTRQQLRVPDVPVSTQCCCCSSCSSRDCLEKLLLQRIKVPAEREEHIS
jgi:hypothetical protein